jgi:hypothetical protein
VDGDGFRDIVAPSSSGEVWAVHGENGHVVDNWPFYVEGRSFFASPLSYDFDVDGNNDLLLTTTDAEVLFIRANGSLFYGDTIIIPPLHVKKDWYNLDKDYAEKLAREMSEYVGLRFQYNPGTTNKRSTPGTPTNDYFSEDDSQFGRYDILYSRHQPGDRPAGLDPKDDSFVFVDPHVLATPVIADTNEDGREHELIVPVSYYFDKYHYGISENLLELKLAKDELVNYAAAGIVVIDLMTRQVVKHKLLSLSKVTSDQPSFLLAPPTVFRFARKEELSIVIGSSCGQLYGMRGRDLSDIPGFPVTTDSITSQVAVEDIIGNDGIFELVVGDASGNVMCIDKKGQQLWENNLKKTPIETSVRIADFNSDNALDIAVITKYGEFWILNGVNGQPIASGNFHVNGLVLMSPLIIRLPAARGGNNLMAIVPTLSGLYVIDPVGHCVGPIASESEPFGHHVLQSDHIDPFNPGLEILTTSLSGQMMCISIGPGHLSDYNTSVGTWVGETLGGNGFTYKENSFVLVCQRDLNSLDASGKTFRFSFQLHDRKASMKTPRYYRALLMIGSSHVLLNESLIVLAPDSNFEYDVRTPPIPFQATMILKVCNEHKQCDSVPFNVRFNTSFQENLSWSLSVPFLALVLTYLWFLRNESSTSPLPTVVSQKTL